MMNRDLPTWNATEENNDQLRILYKGKQFIVPRSEYTRKLTQEDHKRAGLASEGCEKIPAMDESRSSRQKRDTIDNHLGTKKLETRLFSKLMDGLTDSSDQSSSATHTAKKMEPVQNYTLEDAVESNETVVERPVRKITSSERAVTRESHPKGAAQSAESMNSRKSQEITGKLSELKGKLADLIDQTIDQLESQQNLTKVGVEVSAEMFPDGDGTRMVHRMHNLQLLKTDSFAQTKREVRLRLFTEIETILLRLKDMEQLE